MSRLHISSLITVIAFGCATAHAEKPQPQKPQYLPVAAYLMDREAEVALARSAAPEAISTHATVKVLTKNGYQTAVTGDTGFTCLVLRGWAAPTYSPPSFRDLVYVAAVRAPICFDPVATRVVMPYYELRARLGLEGKSPDEI